MAARRGAVSVRRGAGALARILGGHPLAAPACGFGLPVLAAAATASLVLVSGGLFTAALAGAKTTHGWLRALSRSVSLPAYRDRLGRRPLASCA
jgi:hypothetical protein